MFAYASYLTWRGPGEERPAKLWVRFVFAGVILGSLFAALYFTRDEQKVRGPGDPATYAEIEETTDCVALRLRADSLVGDARRYAPGDRRRDVADGYLEATRDRQRELRCD